MSSARSTWVKLHRKIADNPVIRHPAALQVLIWCMVKVQRNPYRHKTRWGAVDLLPGEVMTARRELAQNLSLTERQIRTALKLLVTEQILTIKTTNTHSIITLTNWANLQDRDEEATSTTTSTRPADDQQTTQEQESKKERKKEETNKTAASAAWQSDSDFMQFWNAWPRSCRKGSPVPAYRAWLKNKPPLTEVLAFLAWKRREPIWTNTDPQGKDFIPMPSTFLNGAGWLEQKESGRGNGTGRMERPAGIKFDDRGEVIF